MPRFAVSGALIVATALAIGAPSRARAEPATLEHGLADEPAAQCTAPAPKPVRSTRSTRSFATAAPRAGDVGAVLVAAARSLLAACALPVEEPSGRVADAAAAPRPAANTPRPRWISVGNDGRTARVRLGVAHPLPRDSAPPAHDYQPELGDALSVTLVHDVGGRRR